MLFAAEKSEYFPVLRECARLSVGLMYGIQSVKYNSFNYCKYRLLSII